MMPTARFTSILEKLLEKSRLRQVNWQPSIGPSRNRALVSTWYEVLFPESRVLVGFVSPQTGEDYLSVVLCRSDGPTIAELRTYLESADSNEDSAQRSLVVGLYNEAERAVTRWDEVVEDLEKALSSSGQVGINPEPTPF